MVILKHVYLKRKFLQYHVLEIFLLLEGRRLKGQTKMTHIQMSSLRLACYSFVRICLCVCGICQESAGFPKLG